MNTTRDLALVFETVTGRDHKWTIKNVRPDIAAVFRPLVQDIIDSGLYDAGTKGDLVTLKSASLIEITVNEISPTG